MQTPTKREAALAIAFALAVALWYYMLPDNKPVGTWQQATTAPAVAAIPKERIVTKYIYVYPKAAKAAGDLPPEIKNDDNKSLIDAVKLTCNDDHPKTVASILDTVTGQTQIITRDEPLPWLAAESRGALGIQYGLGNNGLKGRLAGRWEAVEVKALHLGLAGTVDTDRAAFGGVSLDWHF